MTTLMMEVAKGAAGEAGSSLVGWVLGSSGSADQDEAVLDQIEGDLENIEQTLSDIETEISELVSAIGKLDCDTWIQDAEQYVFPIENLWNPNAATVPPAPGATPQQSYTGIVAESKNNTVTLEDMQSWVDQVLNNDGQGIGGQSLLNDLQDLAGVLYEPGTGSGLIQTCLSQSQNLPGNFHGQTDDVYYDTVVAPLIDYYYGIQAKGVTMVVEALNFEAWQAAGSPVSDEQTIDSLPESICGDTATGTVLEFCENATWAVLGTDGQSGVRGRVAEQMAYGGAPYTTDPSATSQPVHRFLGSNSLWSSSPALFSSLNSPASCPELDSNAPCGILAGLYSNTAVGGAYGGYGAGLGGTWVAASGPGMYQLFATGPGFTNDYTNVGDYMMKKLRFLELPDNVIFITNQVTHVQPYSNMTVGPNVISFTDTGLTPEKFYPYYGPQTASGYINVDGLQYMTSAPYCQYFSTNPALPPASENNGFYVGSSEFCPGNQGAWTGGPPGWTVDVGAANNHPQFRLPVILVDQLTCKAGFSPTNAVGERSMCGSDLQAWLDAQVPPAPAEVSTSPGSSRTIGQGHAHGKGGAQGGPDVLGEPVTGDLLMAGNVGDGKVKKMTNGAPRGRQKR